jgi:hypothetical protein
MTSPSRTFTVASAKMPSLAVFTLTEKSIRWKGERTSCWRKSITIPKLRGLK